MNRKKTNLWTLFAPLFVFSFAFWAVADWDSFRALPVILLLMGVLAIFFRLVSRLSSGVLFGLLLLLIFGVGSDDNG